MQAQFLDGAEPRPESPLGSSAHQRGSMQNTELLSPDVRREGVWGCPVAGHGHQAARAPLPDAPGLSLPVWSTALRGERCARLPAAVPRGSPLTPQLGMEGTRGSATGVESPLLHRRCGWQEPESGAAGWLQQRSPHGLPAARLLSASAVSAGGNTIPETWAKAGGGWGRFTTGSWQG